MKALSDASGNRVGILNGQGDKTQHEYNVQNNLAQTENALHAISKRTYDAAGNVTSITDYQGHITHYTYNAFNQITEIKSPDHGVQKFHYNSIGQLNSSEDAKGQKLLFSYDLLNRLTNTHIAGQKVREFEYDQGPYAIGHLSTAKTPHSNLTYAYDPWGNITKHTWTINGQGYSVHYDYEEDQLLQRITYPSGLQINYTLDTSSQIAEILAQSKEQSLTLAKNISYLPFGPVLELTLGNGSYITRQYDRAYQLIHQTVSGISDDHYLYNKVGNITQFINQKNPEKSKQDEYDAVQRLIAMKSTLELQTFSYDDNGNRLSIASTTEGNKTYQYENTSNKLNSQQDIKGFSIITHDANGNITQLGNLSFTYDAFNNLTSVFKAGEKIAAYEYNVFNQRILKTVNNQPIAFIYDQYDKLIEIKQPHSTIDIVYLNEEPVAQFIDGIPYYFVNDALGTPQYLLGQSSETAWSADTLPFQVKTEGDIQQDLRFPGQVYNTETGLVYNNAREYVPSLGRFLQPDPLGLLHSGSLNNYTYTDNNPVNLTDPTSQFIPVGAVITAVAEAAPVVTRTLWTAYRTLRVADNLAKITQANKEGQICPFSKGKSFYRNMSAAEAEAVRRSGKLRGGNPGKTFFTDSRYNTATEAKDRLSLFETPAAQMEFKIKNNPEMKLNGTSVSPLYGGKGGGKEYMTTDSVEVEIVNVQLY